MHCDKNGCPVLWEKKSEDGTCTFILRDNRPLREGADPLLRCCVAELVFNAPEIRTYTVRKRVTRFKDRIPEFYESAVDALRNELNLKFFSRVCGDPELLSYYNQVKPDLISPKVRDWAYLLEFFRKVSSLMLGKEKQYPFFSNHIRCVANDDLRVNISGYTLQVNRTQTYMLIKAPHPRTTNHVTVQYRFLHPTIHGETLSFRANYPVDEIPNVKKFVSIPRYRMTLTSWINMRPSLSPSDVPDDATVLRIGSPTGPSIRHVELPNGIVPFQNTVKESDSPLADWTEDKK